MFCLLFLSFCLSVFLSLSLSPSLSLPLTRSLTLCLSLSPDRYVYFRTGGSLAATYFISAFWHGFYPGYYMFFLSLPLMTQCERIGRKKLTPYFGANEKGRFGPWGIVTIISTEVMLCYIGIPFLLLSGEWAVEAWKNLFFGGHVVMVIFYFVCSVVPTKRTVEGDKKKK